MKSLKISVFGAGSGGHAMVAYLLSRGFEIQCWWNRSQARLEEIAASGQLVSSGKINGVFKLPPLSSDIEKAVQVSDFLFVVIPADGHELLAKSMKPFLKNNKCVLLNPGRTAGAICFRKNLGQINNSSVVIGETQTLSFTSRSGRNGSVHVYAIKSKNDVGFIGEYWDEKIYAMLKTAFPMLSFHAGTLYTSLMNIGAMLHPAPLLLNAGLLESGAINFHYNDGISPLVARFIERLDMERIAIGQKLGQSLPSLIEWFRSCYQISGESLYEVIHQCQALMKIQSPKTLRCRYIYEDISTGIVPMLELARLLGTPCETIDTLCRLACSLTEVDFMKFGRNMSILGISQDMNEKEIINLFQMGAHKKK